jgi:hypothetical protein
MNALRRALLDDPAVVRVWLTFVQGAEADAVRWWARPDAWRDEMLAELEARGLVFSRRYWWRTDAGRQLLADEGQR